MNEAIYNKLMYLLEFMDYYIEQSVYDVLNDSDVEPEYSAVTTNNLIMCYIDIMHKFDQGYSNSNREEYLMSKCFTQEEISIFEDKRQKESAYYMGEQY